MPIGTQSFVELLSTEVPELADLIAEHIAYYDELLLHVLTAEVRDRAFAEFSEGDRTLAARICSVYASGLTDGDERVANAVSVSFVEDTPLWDPARRAFIGSWPAPLQAEANRQRDGCNLSP